MSTSNINTIQFPSDPALRVGDFALLPKLSINPIIGSQPSSNIAQTTWIASVENNNIIYQKIKPIDGIFKVVRGTRLTWNVFASDPTNLAAPNSDATLSFVWRRDGVLLVDINNSNSYRGSDNLLLTEPQCTPEASGVYVCEVSNQIGRTESEGLNLQVIDLDQYPKLYSNLLINGNADSQLDGWSVDPDILSKEFASSLFLSNGFGSMPKLYEMLSTKDGLKYNSGVEFVFSQNHSDTLYRAFFPWIQSGPGWQNVDPEWMQVKPDQSVDQPLAAWRRWVITGVTPQIIDNEAMDPGEPFGGFFPAMKYIDQYNLNHDDTETPVIGLKKESEDQRLSYFTRDKLKFTKYGGKATSQMTQVVDLLDLADFIDGNVYGVAHATSQFFAYVGAGLTRYKIRAQVAGQGRTTNQTFNWFIANYDDFMARLEDDLVTGKVVLVPNTPIEIIPLVEDITQVEIAYLDQQGRQLSKDLVDGPSEREVFAIKDHTFLPLNLYPLFEFLIASNNPIKVFGQTYTTTEALKPLFEDATPYPQQYWEVPDGDSPAGRFAAWGGDQNKLGELTDAQAKFTLSKLNWMQFGSPIPIGYNLKPDRKSRALKEGGAAAMFGVEKTRIIPRGTRSARITVRFTHTSDVILDNDPKAKKWPEQTIYYDVLGQSSGTSRRVVDYSYPRCGITKMKFLVVPNNFSVSTKFPSYKLPPPQNTVVGYRVQRLNQNVHNSADPEIFPYFDVDTATDKFPLAVPLRPSSNNPFLTNTEALFLIAQQQNNLELEDQVAQSTLGQLNQDTNTAEETGQDLFRADPGARTR